MSEKLFNYGVVDPSGSIIYSSDDLIRRAISPDFVSGCMGSRQIALGAFDDRDQLESLSVVYLPIELVNDSGLLAELRALRVPTGSVLVACLVPLAERAEIFTAFEAFGLTGLEARVMVALMLTGTVPLAAQRVGVTYNTARSCVNSILKRTGHYTHAALISLFLSLPLQDQVDDAAATKALSAIYSLSDRQARIVQGLAAGLDRQHIMKQAGCSAPVLKSELVRIYDLTNTANQIELIKLVVEAGLISFLTSPNLDLLRGAELKSLQVAGRTLSYRDYGPPEGVPALFIHSSMTTGVVPSRLAALLIASGFRILSLDRPGFGLTETVPGCVPGRHDPFAIAARDVVSLCQHLEISRIHLMSRGGAQVATAIHSSAPDLLDRVVLVNPDPNLLFDSRSVGPIGAAKVAITRSPAAIKFMARAYAALCKPGRVRSGVTKIMGPDGPDAEAMSDPVNMDDYVNSVLSFRLGRVDEYINEQIAMATMDRPATQDATGSWVVIIGERDFLHDPENTIAYWSDILPEARIIRIPDGGRMLTYSHPHQVAEALMAPPAEA